MAHTGTGRLNVKTLISSGNACSISRAFPGVWSHLLCAWVWESRWTLFTLEKSEKLGSPILKLTGPFGSNHQMCHGKKSTVSHCKGRQAAASINILLSRLAIDVNVTGFTYIKLFSPIVLQVLLLWGQRSDKRWTIISLFPLTHSDEPRWGVADKQTKKGWAGGFYQRHPSN